MSSRSGLTTFLLSLVLSVALVGYLLSRIRLADLVQTFTGIHLPSLGLYGLLALLGSGLRAYRYRILIGPERISPRGIFLVTLIRNLFVDLLPAKLGALSYIYLLVRRFGLSLEIGTSTFILAGLFDALALSPLLLLAMFMVGLGQTLLSTTQFFLVALGFLLLLILLLVSLASLLRTALRIGSTLLHGLGLGPRWGIPSLVRKARSIIEAIEAIQGRGIYGTVFLLSFLLRLVKYGSLYVLLHALLLSQGFPLASLSFWTVTLGIAGAEFSANLPIQGIAGLGTWETAFALAFRLMGHEERIAIVSGFGLHLITNLFEYSLGALAILWLALQTLGRGRPGESRVAK